jgi:hypothetical protein
MMERIRNAFKSTTVYLPLDKHIRMLRADIKEDREMLVLGIVGTTGYSIFIAGVLTISSQGQAIPLGIFLNPVFDAFGIACSVACGVLGSRQYVRHRAELAALLRTLEYE